MKDQEGGGESERGEASDVSTWVFHQIGGSLGGEEDKRHVCTGKGKDRSCVLESMNPNASESVGKPELNER